MWGPVRIRSPLFLLCSFLCFFLFVFFPSVFPCVIACSLLSFVGSPMSLFTDGFPCYGWPPKGEGGPKRRVGLFRDGVLLDRVCLSLERGFAAMIDKARLGMRSGLGALSFRGFH